MPSTQRGSVVKRGKHWGARFYDESGTRRFRGGFQTKSEAREWVEGKANEVLALRRGELIPTRDRPETVDALLDLFLSKHGRTIDPATKRKLTAQLRKARDEFGERQPDSLRKVELEDWRETLPQALGTTCFGLFVRRSPGRSRAGYATRDASAGIRNPKRKRHERRDVHPFESWDEVVAVAEELDPRYRAIPIVGVGCGLRPEELFGLHRADVDRGKRSPRSPAVHRRRVKQGGKTEERAGGAATKGRGGRARGDAGPDRHADPLPRSSRRLHRRERSDTASGRRR